MNDIKHVYCEYLKDVRDAIKTNAMRTDYDVMDYTIAFCEKHNLCADFVACNLNLLGFYAFARYKAGEISIKSLEKIICNVVNKHSALKNCS